MLLHSKAATKTGISALAAFLLSTAMRVGPGNILGVTGAISIGGPGALFWMWLSAFFGMSTAFAESTLSQIFKEKRDGQYVGGLPFYGRRLLNNAAWAGVALSVLYIVYAFLCFPAQGFNTISAVGAIANEITGTMIATNSTLYWISFVVLILIAALISFGGNQKSDKGNGSAGSCDGGDLCADRSCAGCLQLYANSVVFSGGIWTGIFAGCRIWRSLRHSP